METDSSGPDGYTRPWDAQRAIDHLAIQQVIYRWCSSVDKLDFAGIRSVFHPDAYDAHGPYQGGVDGLIEWIRKRHEGISYSHHMVGNMRIEFASSTLAIAETYTRTMQRYKADAAQSLNQLFGNRGVMLDGGAYMLTSGRYVDKVEKRGGEWRILHRQVIAEWKGVQPVQAGDDDRSPDWVYFSRDQDDYFFRTKRDMGIA